MKAGTLEVTNDANAKTKKERKGAKAGAVIKQKADLPEFIKPEDLKHVYPFTIFSANEHKGRFGPRIVFGVAFKEGNSVTRRVLALSDNTERREMMYAVRTNEFITDCRLIKIHLGGDQTYWKIVDVDTPLTEFNLGDETTPQQDLKDEDIPF